MVHEVGARGIEALCAGALQGVRPVCGEVNRLWLPRILRTWSFGCRILC